MERDSFIFYRSFYEAIKELPDKEKIEVFNAICEYTLNGKEIETKGISRAMWCVIKPILPADEEKPKGRPTRFNYVEIIDLCHKGLTDGEVAEKIGCSIATVRKARLAEKGKMSKDATGYMQHEYTEEQLNAAFVKFDEDSDD